MTLQCLVAAAHFVEDVLHSGHVFLGTLKFTFGFAASHLELRDAGCLFEEASPFFRLIGENLIDESLLHHRVGGFTHAGIEEEFPYFLETNRGSVEIVLAFTFPVYAPFDGDFRAFDVENAFFIGDGEGNFGCAEGLSVLGAAEDYVFHAFGTHTAHRLFAENPFDCIDDVALSAAVGAQKSGYTFGEVNNGSIGEGFESE